MRFAILGPVEVTDRGVAVALSRPRHRALLVFLLLNANQVVSVGQISEALWGGAAPATAKSQLHSMMSALRRDLGSDATIDTTADGYRMMIQSGQLDLADFAAAVADARDAMRLSDWVSAAKSSRGALDLWRGDALGGVQAAYAGTVRVRLDEERVQAEELLIEAELAMGRHTAVIGQLRDLRRRFPSRERLATHLMLALHRSDRRTEALEVARQLRDRLRQEQGLDPGESFEALERAVMQADPALDWDAENAASAAPAVRAEPRQLPAQSLIFVGRDGVSNELEGLFRSAGPSRVAAIHGAGGTGKSSLAVRVAHAVADRFPDGQLYVDLRGHQIDMVPLAPAEVLGRFLRALGTSPRLVPDNVDEAAALYRTVLAGRSVLIVLDNASGITQILPLLPASPGCGVVITSRHAMPTLQAHHVGVGALSETYAVELIAHTAGPARVAADPVSAKAIARLCEHLPLAIKVAGARLATDPALTLAAFRERLMVHRRRLDLLAVDDLAVRACFQTSYQSMRSGHRGFRLLGLLQVSHITPPVMAALLASSVEEAETVLDQLAHARLIEANGGRYLMHDLLRLFATELVAVHEPAQEQTAALHRALACYLGAVRRAGDLLRPGQYLHGRDQLADPPYSGHIPLPGDDVAVQWLEAERSNLTSIARQVADAPEPACRFTMHLAAALRSFLPERGYSANWEQLSLLALEVARRVGDPEAEAISLMDLGVTAIHAGRLPQSRAYLESGLEIAEAADLLSARAGITTVLADIYLLAGDHSLAVACFEKAIAARREIGNETLLAGTLTSASFSYVVMNLPDAAAQQAEESIGILTRINHQRGEGPAWIAAAGAYLFQQRIQEAMRAVEAGLELTRRFNNTHHELNGLLVKATIHRLTGDLQASADASRQAVKLCRRTNDVEGGALANDQLAKLAGNAATTPDSSGPRRARLVWIHMVTSLR